jgi:hypothetical protein
MEQRQYTRRGLTEALTQELGRPPTPQEYNSRYKRERYRSDGTYRQRTLAQVHVWKRRNADARVKRLYGLTRKDIRDRVTEQGGCAICHTELDEPHVDHDHTTGEVRGILCPFCNRGLGQFRDSPELLRIAAAYLENLFVKSTQQAG